MAAAAETDVCRGHWVRSLAGPHAVTRKPIVDVASLRQRLPELEASIRTVIAKDASLSPAVADALIAAIRGGSAPTQRPMRRDEAVRWMAYQPEPGRIDAISPACLRLARDYDAFEFTVEVPDPAPMAKAPTCAITATRSCAADNHVFNLGESAGKATAPADPAASSEKSVIVGRCPADTATPPAAAPAALAPVAAPPSRGGSKRSDAGSDVAGAPVAGLCEAGWIVRPFLFGYSPTGNELARDILLPSGPARESFEIDNGYGIGASVERRMGPVLGVEGALMVGRGTSEYHIEGGGTSGQADHDVTFQALTLGPNFHLLGCSGVDLYLGPFLGYGGFADPNYWVGGHHFGAQFDRRFLWGAQLGLDVPFGDGPWGFHGGLRYIDLSQDTDAGKLEVDPLLLELGLSYRF